MFQELGELDGKENLEVGGDGPGTVGGGQGLRDEPGGSRLLRMEGYRRDQ